MQEGDTTMNVEKEIHPFTHYRIFERNVFSLALSLLALPLKNVMHQWISVPQLYLAAMVFAGLFFFLCGAAATAVLPFFRKEGSWWVEDGYVVIAPENDAATVIVADPTLLYFSDPLMIGFFLHKKCVLEVQSENFRLLMMSVPMNRRAPRSENPLWLLFAEIRNRNLDLERVGDTQGHMVDYWYIRTEEESRQMKYMQQYYPQFVEKYKNTK